MKAEDAFKKSKVILVYLYHHYNWNENKAGQPFPICQRHYDKMMASLGRNNFNGHCEVLALNAVHNCNNCEREKEVAIGSNTAMAPSDNVEDNAHETQSAPN